MRVDSASIGCFSTWLCCAQARTVTHRRNKEGRNVLYNDALNTFYLRLYCVRHMVKDHSDSERGDQLPPHGLLFPISSKGYTHIHTHTYIHTYIHTYTRTYIHTYIHTHVHTYIHTHTYINTYVHTYIHT